MKRSTHHALFGALILICAAIAAFTMAAGLTRAIYSNWGTIYKTISDTPWEVNVIFGTIISFLVIVVLGSLTEPSS